jgi:anti-sigma B factor antagonist
MEHSIHEEQDVTVVSFSGEIDLGASPRARALLLECVRRDRNLRVDLTAVTYIDSSGVASLIEAFQSARKHGTEFALVGVSASVRRVLELGRLDRIIPILDGTRGGS